MNQLISINKTEDIPSNYQQTPFAKLLEYHNLLKTLNVCENPELIIGTCVDNRIQLRFPRKFAYTVRAGGANMKYNEFKISYAIAVGNVKYMALIGHNHCGMSGLNDRKELFIQGLVNNAGWSKKDAEEHFRKDAPASEIGKEVEFIVSEAIRLQKLYPEIQFAPLMYDVEENKLFVVKSGHFFDFYQSTKR